MKKLLICLTLSIMTTGLIFAAEENLPEGMEEQQVDPGFKLVLPKGTAVRKVGDLRVIESSGEYSARRLEEFNQRLKQIDSEIQALRKDVETLKKRYR